MAAPRKRPFTFVQRPIGWGEYEPEGIYLSAPFEGARPLLQRWGEHPQFYRQYSVEGVALQGHNGIDFELPVGTKLLAVAAGRVVESGRDEDGYGLFVSIQHRWGFSLYAHLQTVAVHAGQLLERGEVLGQSGNSGRSQMPHLHFSIRIDPFRRSDGWGGYTNPLPFLAPSAILV